MATTNRRLNEALKLVGYDLSLSELNLMSRVGDGGVEKGTGKSAEHLRELGLGDDDGFGDLMLTELGLDVLVAITLYMDEQVKQPSRSDENKRLAREAIERHEQVRAVKARNEQLRDRDVAPIKRVLFAAEMALGACDSGEEGYQEAHDLYAAMAAFVSDW